jgi:hypothetical protein
MSPLIQPKIQADTLICDTIVSNVAPIIYLVNNYVMELVFTISGVFPSFFWFSHHAFMGPLIQPKVQAGILMRDAVVSKCGPNPTVNCDIFG